jgi:hypothetical protein
VSIAARLRRLEQSRGARGCGPRCPPVRYVCEDDWYGPASEPPAPCPHCGCPKSDLGWPDDVERAEPAWKDLDGCVANRIVEGVT